MHTGNVINATSRCGVWLPALAGDFLRNQIQEEVIGTARGVIKQWLVCSLQITWCYFLWYAENSRKSERPKWCYVRKEGITKGRRKNKSKAREAYPSAKREFVLSWSEIWSKRMNLMNLTLNEMLHFLSIEWRDPNNSYMSMLRPILNLHYSLDYQELKGQQ